MNKKQRKLSFIVSIVVLIAALFAFSAVSSATATGNTVTINLNKNDAAWNNSGMPLSLVSSTS
ncbi:MAG: hypothetical protein IJK98_01725, partial [Clostridia bacterium]|nr:hypothetical protein [Clostridia bacterium]